VIVVVPAPAAGSRIRIPPEPFVSDKAPEGACNSAVPLDEGKVIVVDVPVEGATSVIDPEAEPVSITAGVVTPVVPEIETVILLLLKGR
jgi:hypothetical protein